VPTVIQQTNNDSLPHTRKPCSSINNTDNWHLCDHKIAYIKYFMTYTLCLKAVGSFNRA